jgi:FkbM family methyltransferase
MKYDYIEIGTSDFDTITETIHNPDTLGLCIEPIKYYLDRVPLDPVAKGIKKINIAISDISGAINVFYCSESVMSEYKLPSWIRGCNSIGDYHPTVTRELKKRGIDEKVVSIKKVKTLSYKDLVLEHNITEVEYLKIDTEGHDCTILNAMMEFHKDSPPIFKMPRKIRFEANILSDAKMLIKIVEKLRIVGYKVVERTAEDIVVEKLND